MHSAGTHARTRGRPPRPVGASVPIQQCHRLVQLAVPLVSLGKESDCTIFDRMTEGDGR